MCTCAHTHKQDKVKTSDTKRQQTRKKEKQDKKQETKYLQNSQTTRTKPMKRPLQLPPINNYFKQKQITSVIKRQ